MLALKACLEVFKPLAKWKCCVEEISNLWLLLDPKVKERESDFKEALLFEDPSTCKC